MVTLSVTMIRRPNRSFPDADCHFLRLLPMAVPAPARQRQTAFMADGMQGCYRRGELGRTLHDGGSGEAEQLLVECLRLLSRRYAEDWLTLLTAARSGLVMSYQPAIDLALHELIGFVSRGSRHHTPAREQRIWPLLIDLLIDFDQILEASRSILSEDDVIIVTSDHGMNPIDLIIRPNVVLQRLGYLKIDGADRIDPDASLLFYHPAECGLVCINQKLCSLAGVSGETLLAALLTEIDALTGRKAQIAPFAALEKQLRPPSWLTARHYLSGGTGIQIKSEVRGAACQASTKTGEHVVMNDAVELVGTIIDLSMTAIAPNWPGRIPTHAVGRLLMGPDWPSSFVKQHENKREAQHT